MPSEQFWNVPNALTLSRLVLALAVFALIAYGYYFAALATFGLAALTDALDGYFARLLNQETAIGRQLDPLVDKVIVCGAFIYLMTVPETGVMPWMVTAIVVRELVVQAIRSLIEGRGEAFGARLAGKLKTTVQCLALAAILLSLAIPLPPGWKVARDVLIWLSVILTIYSGMSYLFLAWPKLKTAS